MYGAQTDLLRLAVDTAFENDVEMYGAQTPIYCCGISASLRMM